MHKPNHNVTIYCGNPSTHTSITHKSNPNATIYPIFKLNTTAPTRRNPAFPQQIFETQPIRLYVKTDKKALNSAKNYISYIKINPDKPDDYTQKPPTPQPKTIHNHIVVQKKHPAHAGYLQT